MKSVIGIDIGGTSIKLGQFAEDGNCSSALTIATPQPSRPLAVVDAIAAAIDRLDPDGDTVALGVGMPGPADANGRIARVAINLSDWHDVPLADWLEDRTGRSTTLANDANCAGLGECWLGAGRLFQDVLMLTLGTGVGGAIVLGGELFVGRQGTAGELGLITLNPAGPPCNSGNRGSLEQYASVQAVRRRTGREPHEMATLAREGDREAIAFWQDYGHDLGAGLASLIYIFTPSAIILGGGISASADLFLPATRSEIERRVLLSSREGLELLPAELGNQAGMVGAARLAWSQVERSVSQSKA